MREFKIIFSDNKVLTYTLDSLDNFTYSATADGRIANVTTPKDETGSMRNYADSVINKQIDGAKIIAFEMSIEGNIYANAYNLDTPRFSSGISSSSSHGIESIGSHFMNLQISR